MQYAMFGWTERRDDRTLASVAIMPTGPSVPVADTELYQKDVAAGTNGLTTLVLLAEAIANASRRRGNAVMGLKISSTPPAVLASFLQGLAAKAA